MMALGQAQAPVTPTGPGQTYTAADVEGALDKAEEFRNDGVYQEALNLHIWYHKNALKYDPAQYGVRLSYALDDWAELGKVYPPALHELRSIRNETLATYKKNPSDSLMFGEVASIDLSLDDLASLKQLFYLGRKGGVRDFGLLLHLDRITATGDLRWASDVIGDPIGKLEGIKDEREESNEALRSHPDLAKDEDRLFADETAQLLRAVAKVKGLASARKLQKRALKFLDMAAVRNALVAQ